MIALKKGQYKWGFVCGRIDALEARRLTKEFFTSLVSQTRTEDIFRLLQDTVLRDALAPGAAWDDFSGVVDRHFYEEMLSLRNDCPDPRIVDLFLLPGDYLNLKRAILHQHSFPFYPATLAAEKLAQVESGDRSALPPPLRDAVAALLDDHDETGHRAVMDIVLDGEYLRQLLTMSAALNIPLVSAYVEDLVLARAVVVLWRVVRANPSMRVYQQYFLPIGKLTSLLNDVIATPDPTEWGGVVKGTLGLRLQEAAEQSEEEQVPRFEQLVANHLLEMSKRSQGQTFGPERVFGYLAALATEAYNLKLAVSGRTNRADTAVLRQRLRECHG
ncbi:MAG: V-type ATPase subunit [Candidatus Hydrogenedentes bacterium]|nr:V-type ATPase subunit [Candidatus Hydrogenedentota bacterium]